MSDIKTPRSILLSADDYGIAPGVSRAILDLVEAGRLTGTSCMTVSPFWPEHATWLRPHAGRAEIGLHFVLTDMRPLGPMPRLAPNGRFPSLPRALALASARQLDPVELDAELNRQLDRFEMALGRPPDFIDGHHHVHQLPMVREVVLRSLSTRLPTGTWVRICDEPVAGVLHRGGAVPQALIISWLGRGLRRGASRLGIPANRRFAGVRTFKETAPYRDLFRRFVADAPEGLLVMCHPGRADADLAAVDWVTRQRDDEYAYLKSEAFVADLAEAGVILGRFKQDGVRGRSSASD